MNFGFSINAACIDWSYTWNR